jgi:hypothetical protein
MYVKMVVSMLHTKQGYVVASAGLHCTDVELQMGENECGSQTCMFDLYVIDVIKKGVFICLGLFINDDCMLMEKESVELF